MTWEICNQVICGTWYNMLDWANLIQYGMILGLFIISTMLSRRIKRLEAKHGKK